MQAVTGITTDNEELRDELEEILGAYFRSPRRVRRMIRRQSAYSSSCPILNLTVELNTGKELSLVLKDLSPSSLLEDARRVRPCFLYEPRREIEMYRTVLNSKLFDTPTFYGAAVRKD